MKTLHVLFVALFCILFTMTPLFADGYAVHRARFDTIVTDTLVAADVDTSAAFLLAKNYRTTSKLGTDYPTTLTIQTITSEINDSTWVSTTLQVSMDGSNWETVSILDTTTIADGNFIAQVSSFDSALWGRLLNTSAVATGDTLVVQNYIGMTF